MIDKFHTLQKTLIDEAKASPGILNDLAGLEQYIAESYQSRSIVELLQNADDAGASNFLLETRDRYIVCANDGRELTADDLEALCRSAASKKTRGESIGYRGIGFKSVTTFSKKVSIFNKSIGVVFSKKHTQKKLELTTDVPLLRIPHISDDVSEDILDRVRQLREKGFTTIFIFEEIQVDEVYTEIERIPATLNLFLRNIENIKLASPKFLKKISTQRILENNLQRVIIRNDEITQEWILFSRSTTSVAIPVFETNETSKIHVFLPTEDESGLRCVINGDFSTDPARRHIKNDTLTEDQIRHLAALYSDALIFAFKNKDQIIIKNLIPTTDLATIALKKIGFQSIFFSQLKSLCDNIAGNYNTTPLWMNLNQDDTDEYFQNNNKIASFSKESSLFFKFLGIRELKLSIILEELDLNKISYFLRVQVCSRTIKSLLSPISEIQLPADAKIFFADKKPIDLIELKNGTLLDSEFAEHLIAEGLSEEELKRFCKIFLNCDFDNVMRRAIKSSSPTSKTTGNNLKSNALENQRRGATGTTKLSTTNRWRAAELLVLDALCSSGYKLRDVSKSNLGYDLEGTDPNGTPTFIEVKSIKYPGEKVRFTNNEVALCRELKDRYILALALLDKNTLKIQLIASPIEKLLVTRQCVQWIWEVENYEFTPENFELSD